MSAAVHNYDEMYGEVNMTPLTNPWAQPIKDEAQPMNLEIWPRFGEELSASVQQEIHDQWLETRNLLKQMQSQIDRDQHLIDRFYPDPNTYQFK